MTEPTAAPATPPTGAAGALAEPPAQPAVPPATPAEPSVLKLPGNDAKPEDWAAFYRSVGAPEKGDGYGLKVPEGGDPEFLKEATDTFAKAGLRADQAKLLTDWWNEKATGLTKSQSEAATKAEADRITALDTKNKAEEAQLKNDWGQAFEGNMNLARQATKQFFGEKWQDVVGAIEGVVGYKQTMLIMQGIGKGLGEGKEHGLTGSQPAAQGPSLESSFKEALAKAGVKSQ